MISNHPYRLMSIPEKEAFVSAITKAAQKAKVRNPDLTHYIQSLECHLEALTKAYEKIKDIPVVTQLVKYDDIRDNGLINLRDYASICAMNNNVEWATAGETILSAYKDINWDIHRLRNADETSRIDNFLIVLKTYPRLVQAVTTINADHWVEEIELGQKHFKAAFGKYKEECKRCPIIDMQPIIKNLGIAIEQLFQYVNMRLEFAPNDELYAFNHKANDLIASYKARRKLQHLKN